MSKPRTLENMNFSKPLSLVALATAVLIAGCSDSPSDDVHAQPRETQPWENVAVANLGQTELLAHLDQLVAETESAAAAGAYVEFHHLEVAMTPALEALETQAGDKPEALATIAQLKDFAIKLHLAGHDRNVPMGVKLAAVIKQNLSKLRGQLAS